MQWSTRSVLGAVEYKVCSRCSGVQGLFYVQWGTRSVLGAVEYKVCSRCSGVQGLF